MNKKDIPLTLLLAIEAKIGEHFKLIHHADEENCFYCLKEVDEKSKNYFKIFVEGKEKAQNIKSGNFVYEFKPTNATVTEACLTQGNNDNMLGAFNSWIKLIATYNTTKSVHDDDFEKKYSDFYFNEFEIIDEDVDFSPFNPDQQDLIELYLHSLSNAIEESTSITPSLKTELILEADLIIKNLSSSTKTVVMKKITTIFGRLYKHSKNLAKEITSEAKKRLIKSLIDLGVQYGPKLLESIKDIFINEK
jgi:hypothetical protein